MRHIQSLVVVCLLLAANILLREDKRGNVSDLLAIRKPTTGFSVAFAGLSRALALTQSD